MSVHPYGRVGSKINEDLLFTHSLNNILKKGVTKSFYIYKYIHISDKVSFHIQKVSYKF